MMTLKSAFCFILISVSSLLIVTNVNAGIKSIPPADACNLLSSVGLPTLGWKTYYDDECGCASRSRPIGPGNPFRNVLSYFVEGTRQNVRQIRLIVSILNADASEIAHTEFQKAARFLIMKLTGTPVSDNILRAISTGADIVSQAGDFSVEVARKEWTMNTDWGTRQCYEIKLVIR